MASFAADLAAMNDFGGTAPLLPLPNVVVYPHAVVPLHIFEPRYRVMTADILSGDRFLAVGLTRTVGPALRADTTDSVSELCDLPWAEGADDRETRDSSSALRQMGLDPGRMAVHPIVGLARVIAHERTSDGRYYLAIRGVARALLLHEPESPSPYRHARLQLLRDACGLTLSEQLAAAAELSRAFHAGFPGSPLKPVLTEALLTPRPLSIVTDLIAATLPFDPQSAQQLMDTLDPLARYELLAGCLQAHSDAPDPMPLFPPHFSAN